MAITIEAVADFIDYLNDGEVDWIDLGIKPEAPERARKAYAEWQEEERQRMAKGIQ